MKKILFCTRGLFFTLIVVLCSGSCQKQEIAPNSSTGPIHFHQGSTNLSLSNPSFGIAGTLGTRDGGLLVYGNAQALTSSAAFGGADIFLMKFDKSGRELWYKDYSNQNVYFAVNEAYDGGIIMLTGGNFLVGSGVFSFTNYMDKTDADGNLVWVKPMLNNLSTNVTALCGGEGRLNLCNGLSYPEWNGF